MSVIYGNPIITNGGGVKLNIDYGANPPSDTTKLWVPLATKPSAVECSPVLAFGNEIPALAPFGTGYNTFQMNTPCYCQYGNYVFAPQPYVGSYVELIVRYDVTTGEKVTLPLDTSITAFSTYKNQPSFSVGNIIYMFFPSGVAKYDVTTNNASYVSLNNLSWPVTNGSYFISGCVDGTKIYLLGTRYGNSSESSVAVYDTIADDFVFSGRLPNAAQNTHNSSCVASGDNLYVFGGITAFSYDPSKHVQVYNIKTGEFKQVQILPYEINSTCRAIRQGKYAYIFGSASTLYRNGIIKVDLETLTAEKLNDTFAENVTYSAVGFANNKWYIVGYASNVHTFTVSSPLTSNHLFLQEDYGYDGLWTALKSKDTDFKVKVINAYLGDNNNIAQLTKAYLYDSKDLKWKSLSGESYVADMQNALNILGVN